MLEVPSFVLLVMMHPCCLKPRLAVTPNKSRTRRTIIVVIVIVVLSSKQEVFCVAEGVYVVKNAREGIGGRRHGHDGREQLRWPHIDGVSCPVMVGGWIGKLRVSTGLDMTWREDGRMNWCGRSCDGKLELGRGTVNKGGYAYGKGNTGDSSKTPRSAKRATDKGRSKLKDVEEDTEVIEVGVEADRSSRGALAHVLALMH
jgi:hypothetical protein